MFRKLRKHCLLNAIWTSDEYVWKEKCREDFLEEVTRSLESNPMAGKQWSRVFWFESGSERFVKGLQERLDEAYEKNRVGLWD